MAKVTIPPAIRRLLDGQNAVLRESQQRLARELEQNPVILPPQFTVKLDLDEDLTLLFNAGAHSDALLIQIVRLLQRINSKHTDKSTESEPKPDNPIIPS